MKQENKTWFGRGIRDGFPIGLGYFAVAFTLGIAARNASLDIVQATLSSFLCNASAGEFVGFTLMSEHANFFVFALMLLITNARYLLMSCSLSQKLAPNTPLIHRLLIGYEVTDEVFGIAISVPGHLNPWYIYGAMTMAIPGWAIGTGLGVAVGNILPDNIVSALSVGLYGMFLAVIIPPARKSRVLAVIILISMAASMLFTHLPVIATWSTGIRIILLTVLIAGAAAILFPVKEDETDAS